VEDLRRFDGEDPWRHVAPDPVEELEANCRRRAQRGAGGNCAAADHHALATAVLSRAGPGAFHGADRDLQRDHEDEKAKRAMTHAAILRAPDAAGQLRANVEAP
jgi:hypothetical protein